MGTVILYYFSFSLIGFLSFSDKFNRLFSRHAVNVKAQHRHMIDTF